MIYRLGERRMETVGDEYFIAPSADVIGSVRIGRWASVWFGAVLRGDNDWIQLGDGTNIQDGSVLHTDPDIPLVIGNNVTVGHQALLHACTVGDNCMIANGALVLDRAVIGRNTVIAAGALIPPGKIIPSGVVMMGSPAVVARNVSDKDVEMIRRAAEGYIQKAKHYRNDLTAQQ
jgi:carbonic anhydrase/acetyltransferase-like protein (isoleucine patch superfamily)